MLFSIAMNTSRALAINSTWIDATSGGLWSGAGNWIGNTIANGIGATADFSSINITADDTVHLDSARNIGQLEFGDVIPTNNWILDNNGSATNTLNMVVNSGNPQITVIDNMATISLGLSGTGVVSSGAGTLVLGGTTDNSGLGLSVNAGTTVLAKTSSGSPNDVHAIGQPGLTVNGGTAQLGGTGGDQIYDLGSVTVLSGTFDTNGRNETFAALNLQGTGIGNAGALVNTAAAISAIKAINGIVLTANATIGSAFELDLNGGISGNFGLTKIGNGNLTFDGNSANTFTGVLNVNQGTLTLSKTPGVAVSGLLNIGNGTGAPNSVRVLIAEAFQFPTSGGNVAVQSDGVLTIANLEDRLATLTMAGGTVDSFGGSSGEFQLYGSALPTITTLASGNTATISVGTLQLLQAPPIFSTAQGTTQTGIDLDISSQVIDGNGPSGLIKAGTGAMRLSGNNLFSGGVNLNAGTLIIGAINALGSGTLMSGGGALQADGNGPYTISNPINLSTTLIVSGGNNFTLAGPVSGSAGLTKSGSSMLTLSGVESFTGPITVNGGTLAMNTSLVCNVTNSATFIYNNGTFGGRLTNAGTVVLNADFTAGNGMENDSNFSLATGQTVTLNGAGLDNEGTFAMIGGSLNLSATGSNVNRGNFNLSANLGLAIGVQLNNQGSLVLNGGLINGAGLLTNAASGTISGTGTISSGFNNSAGVIAIGPGTINVTHAFTNSGGIQLAAISANLTGGAMTNVGDVQGFGNLGNPINNNGGVVEANGGTLFVTGALSNPAAGTLTADAEAKLLITQGLAANSGIINLTGGTFDNNNHPLNNAGQISGFGIFRTGGTGLDNNGSITFSGGLTTVNGPVTNEDGKTIVVAHNPAIFTGLVTNNGGGTFNIVNTTAIFAGGLAAPSVARSPTMPARCSLKAAEARSKSTPPRRWVIPVPCRWRHGHAAVQAIVSAPRPLARELSAIVAAGATLELAGSVSALSSGSNRVNIINNSTSTGILVSGTHQQVGNIDGVASRKSTPEAT